MATLYEVTQFFDNNGEPLSNGWVYWYVAGTTTAKDTWKDAAEGTKHLNPIHLDGNGRIPDGGCFIRGSYKLKITNSDGSETYPIIDNINQYDSYDFTGLTASAADLNSTTTTAKPISVAPPLVYTVLLSDRGKTLMVNSITANTTINLPSAVTMGDTFKVWIKKTDISTNTVTIVPFGGQTIDGATQKVLYDPNDFVELRSDGSNWYLGGSLIRGTISNLTASHAVVMADVGRIFNCDTSGGSFAITLPTSNSVGRGFWIGFKKVDTSANQVTITPNGSELIDGLSQYILGTQWQFLMIKTDGNNWYVMEASSTAQNFATGDIKVSVVNTQNGWVYLNDGTIGDADSKATTRANADTLALFKALYSITYLKLRNSDGTERAKAGNAETDFHAHYNLDLPKVQARSLISVGSCGQGNTYALCQTDLGQEKHQLSTAELAKHTHPIDQRSSPGVNSNVGAGSTFNDGAPRNAATGETGGDTGHNTLHPVVPFYYLIKL